MVDYFLIISDVIKYYYAPNMEDITSNGSAALRIFAVTYTS